MTRRAGSEDSVLCHEIKVERVERRVVRESAELREVVVVVEEAGVADFGSSQKEFFSEIRFDKFGLAVFPTDSELTGFDVDLESI